MNHIMNLQNYSKKIEKGNAQDILSLTPTQEGMLFHYLKSPGTRQYVEQVCIGVDGSLERTFFNEAWEKTIAENEILRTVFRWESLQNPVQVILKNMPLEIRHFDFTRESPQSKLNSLRQIKRNDREESFDITQCCFRITLCRLETERYEMILSSHHILYDGWSTGIILRDFFRYYRAIFLPESYPLVTLAKKCKFRDYIQYLRFRDTAKEKIFWKNYLAGFSSQTTLPFSRSKTDEISKAKSFQVNLSSDTSAAIMETAQRLNITPASIFYSTWGILLQKYNDCYDVLFGTTVSGRPANIRGIENVVGLFINTPPLRIKTKKSTSVGQLLKQVFLSLQARAEYEISPLTEIMKQSELSGEGFFDSIVVVENYPLDREMTQGKGAIRFVSYETAEMTNYDLTLAITLGNGENLGESIRVHLDYNQELFEPAVIERMAGHFEKILVAITKNLSLPLEKLELVTEKEKHLILKEFNKPAIPYPENKTLHELFTEQAVKTPDLIAVFFQDQGITYRELDRQSSLLANSLRELGAAADEVVGLMTAPSLNMYIGIIAILKAGGAYLPIHLSNPDERIKYMLDDSGAKIWLVQEELLDRIKKTGFSGHILSLSDKSLYNTEKFQAEKKVKPENLAYVIYTSGSTGKPKGVMIEHRNVGNLAAWYSREYGILAGTRSIQLYDYSFDGSVEDIFGSLLYGATLHLADRSLIFDRVKFQEYIEHHEIHIINFIPGMIKELLAGSKKRLSSIKAIISGAERLDEELKNELLGMGYMVYNNYGPTETTVDTLSSKCTSEKVSIGRPVQNSCAYILDEDMNLMPVGIAGELYISGKGVARGYINDSITTEEKFKSSIFDKYERMYKTGDIAKWRENGEIDFIGRIDHQVKIMGFRIELEEIESALMKMPEIKKAVVMVKENPTSLMGFIETKQVISPEEKPNTVATFKERLKKNLPTYMVPAELFIIEKMPLTVNGKIDRQKLMKMDFTEQLPLKKCLPPESEIEKTILDTWKKVLAINDIGITDDFFEIGGNSLSLIRVYSLLNEKLPKRLSVQNLFDYRTIKDLAVLLNGKSQSAIERSSGLSPIQEIEF